MLDVYTKGRVSKISPEAPVPILIVEEKKFLPGGAGNVALNLRSLGAQVVAFGRVGNDLEGDRLKSTLEKHGISTSGIFSQNDYPTILKNRIIADSQQIVRIDQENPIQICEHIARKILDRFIVEIQTAQLIAISDYNKGFLSKELLQKVFRYAHEKNIPIVIDPKGEDFSKYRGATLIKPNLKEAKIATQISSDNELRGIADKILRVTEAQYLLITRSEKGMSLFTKDLQRDFFVESKEVKDVTGAGDAVLAVVSLAMANNIAIEDAIALANIAGSIAVERLGCVNVRLSELAERLLFQDTQNKIFSDSHLHVLQEALKEKKFCIIGLNPNEVSIPFLYEQLRTLKTNDADIKTLLYLQKSNEQISALFSSLREVNFIIEGNTDLMHLDELINPEEVYLLKQSQMVKLSNAEILLSKLQSAAVIT